MTQLSIRVGQSLVFEKERIPLLFAKKSVKKKQKSNLLFFALFKRVKELFALCRSFSKEQKSELLFFALLEKTVRAIAQPWYFLLSNRNRLCTVYLVGPKIDGISDLV